jgi:hypothetical protein
VTDKSHFTQLVLYHPPASRAGESRGGRAGATPVAQEGVFKISFLRRLVSPWHGLSARPRPGLPQTYPRKFLKYIQTQNTSSRELVKIAQPTPACLV